MHCRETPQGAEHASEVCREGLVLQSRRIGGQLLSA